MTPGGLDTERASDFMGSYICKYQSWSMEWGLSATLPSTAAFNLKASNREELATQ